ncbi:MAG: Holliday junction resolvase RuvX [Planctomycetes bacterium]|nr:Holliday junction resolvase RuvX [Planctomycetota bacterium]
MNATRKRGALAIDHGTLKYGFAATDALRISTQPLPTFRGDEAGLFRELAKLLGDRDVDTLVVGLPLNMDGSFGPRAEDVRAFTLRLAAKFPALAVVTFDERLTSKAADELARELDLSRDERRAWKDSLAALALLRDWIASGEPRGA